MVKDNLKFARKQAGLSQVTLADIVGVWQQTISTWEKGESEPSASELIALSDALGVSVEWLVRGQSAPAPALAGASVSTDRAPVAVTTES